MRFKKWNDSSGNDIVCHSILEVAHAGELPNNAIVNILKALPLDITYIDDKDIIRYYSDYRIFKRTPEILGTTVQNCHSPASRAEVDRVIDELRSGRRTISETPGGEKWSQSERTLYCREG